MKKEITIGLLAGLLISLCIVVIYVIAVMKRSDDIIETPQDTIPTYGMDISESEETEAPAGIPITYGDMGSVIYIPLESCGSYDAFIEYPGIVEMLESLVFDIKVTWSAETFMFDGSIVRMSGYPIDGEGSVDFIMDTYLGTAELQYNISTQVVQDKDDFLTISGEAEVGYSSGVRLEDIDAKSSDTIIVNVNDIVDWDSTYWNYDVPDTLRVITKGVLAQDILIDTYMRYVHYYFGDDEIVIWDYDKLDDDVFVLYASVGDWNVTVKLQGDDPCVIQASACVVRR